MRSSLAARILFFVAVALGATGLASPPVSLAMGLAFALLMEHPYAQQSRRAAHLLLQASVVLLGFSMNLGAVLAAGRAGLVYSAIGIGCTLALGLALGWLFRVERIASTLIAGGTAICGGSAIAALGPVLAAGEEPMAVSLGSVFVLNSVALFLFPALGHWLGLSQAQFGVWAALAIHDTSSVVGAAARFGAGALAIAVPIKLVRALWIVPVSLGYAALRRSEASADQRRRARLPMPWFLLWFLLAAAVATAVPGWLHGSGAWLHNVFASLTWLGKAGSAVTLFLIGSSLNRKALAAVGVWPLMQAILLWIVSASASLAAIERGWIRP
jgi:uncharacterized integral membrane protein (TIGR00698 family)